jgi:hypothetical protein
MIKNLPNCLSGHLHTCISLSLSIFLRCTLFLYAFFRSPLKAFLELKWIKCLAPSLFFYQSSLGLLSICLSVYQSLSLSQFLFFCITHCFSLSVSLSVYLGRSEVDIEENVSLGQCRTSLEGNNISSRTPEQ